MFDNHKRSEPHLKTTLTNESCLQSDNKGEFTVASY